MFPSRIASVLGKGALENNYSLDFDGSNDYVDVGTAYNGVKSISFLLKVDDVTSNTDYILGLNDTDYISVVDSTVTLSGFSGGTNTIYVDASEASTVDTAWHHILITSTTARNASNCDLGRTQSNNSYNMVGNIDEVAFTSDVKSASDFADGTTPLDISGLSNLQNWWRMGDGVLDDFPVIADQVNPTLGSDVITNGSMELDSDWTNIGSPTTNEQSATQKYSGSYSRRMVTAGSGWTGIRQTTISVTQGAVYKLTYYIYGASGSAIKVGFYSTGGWATKADGSAFENSEETFTNGSWTEKIIYFKPTGTGDVADGQLQFRSYASVLEVYIDNVSLEKIGGNPGTMINMASDDIVKDTP